MLKAIVAVVVGYLVMVVVVFAGLTAAYLAMGAVRAFKPESYEVTGLWLVVWFLVSVGAAIIGGRICGLIGRKRGAVIGLAIVVLVLGGLAALPALKPVTGDPKPRTSGTSNLEAMMNAKQPNWVVFLTPIIGVVGVLAGGRAVSRPK
jgi:MFS family permease